MVRNTWRPSASYACGHVLPLHGPVGQVLLPLSGGSLSSRLLAPKRSVYFSNSDKDADKGSGQGTDKGADGGNGQPDAGETAPPGNDDASGGGNLPAAPGSGTEPDSVNQGRGDTEE